MYISTGVQPDPESDAGPSAHDSGLTTRDPRPGAGRTGYIVSAAADGAPGETIGLAMISTMQSGIVSTALCPICRKLNVKSESFQ